MNKIFLFLSALFLTLNVYGTDSRTASYILNLNSSNLVASSTNSTAGNVFDLNEAYSPLRIWVSCSGVPANTDGSGALTIKLSAAPGTAGTNFFSSAAYSNIKLVLSNGMATATAAAPLVREDWVVSSGIKYLRVGQMENTYPGAVSNIIVIIGYPK